MGTQQLLLIVLGLIAVLTMIYVGTLLYNGYVADTNRDQVITTLNTISDMCLSYYKKPAELGGGEGEFSGWEIPREFVDTEIGSFRATVRKNKIKLQGIGIETGIDGSSNIIVNATVRYIGTTIAVKN